MSTAAVIMKEKKNIYILMSWLLRRIYGWDAHKVNAN